MRTKTRQAKPTPGGARGALRKVEYWGKMRGGWNPSENPGECGSGRIGKTGSKAGEKGNPQGNGRPLRHPQWGGGGGVETDPHEEKWNGGRGRKKKIDKNKI
jgi:hypothetical protein